ncbi:hypothetical protein V3481_004402 [Fusarium oxysporum f. sp. vasinfectum]
MNWKLTSASISYPEAYPTQTKAVLIVIDCDCLSIGWVAEMWRSVAVSSHNRNNRLLARLNQLGNTTPKDFRKVSEVDNNYDEYHEAKPMERGKWNARHVRRLERLTLQSSRRYPRTFAPMAYRPAL